MPIKNDIPENRFELTIIAVGSDEDSELLLTNTVKKKLQGGDFLSQRISLKLTVGRLAWKTIAMA